MTPLPPQQPSPSVGAIILNGGASRRMGGHPKALLEVEGIPLLERLGKQLVEAGYGPLFVVSGAHADEVSALVLRLSFLSPVRNESWGEGLASSLRAGLGAAALAVEPIVAVLVTPVDLPFATVEDWKRLRHHFLDTRETVATATLPEGYPGAPAIFPREAWAELSGLVGDRGARDWLRRRQPPVACLDLPSLTRDTDTPESWPPATMP